MNKSVGSMYRWCTHTKNYVKGRCPHNCSYCYISDIMKRFKKEQSEPYFDWKEIKENLGINKTIFIGSSIDMFAVDIPSSWIERVIDHCKKFDNTYLFQSKNPKRFSKFTFPKKVILGTTIESNRDYKSSNAPIPRQRAIEIAKFKNTLISIEPIMDFDLDIFIRWIKEINPKFVSIGADSKNHGLPEPNSDKINSLINELRKFTSVKVKDNLGRLM